MKGNQHKKLFNPDYFGWAFYCFGARRRQRQSDKHMAKKAARRERKQSAKQEAEKWRQEEGVKECGGK